jgi:four helix bundle protein
MKYIQLVIASLKYYLERAGGQMLRSGTSPAPNYGEAQDAESRSDFIHKIKIILKELRETRIWLLMIAKAQLIRSVTKLQPLINDCDELISIFVKSAQTARQCRKTTS